MNYAQTLEYLFNQLPMFTRVGASAYKKDLTNTIALCQLLNNPHHQFKTIHVGGTNGKGSTSHMLASVLQQAGYKVGLYTSPHLKDFRERIKINGVMVDEQTVVSFVRDYKPNFDKIKPSFFEWTVALCFYYFALQKVDIAIIEVGLGGRLDSTNIIMPELSVITNIGWDHTDMLGDTLAQIAFEKAGIIKPNTPIVIGEYHTETWPVFESSAQKNNSQITLAESSFALSDITYKSTHLSCNAREENSTCLFPNLLCDLAGIYQTKNIKTVLTAITKLTKMGWQISPENIYQGLASVKANTGLMGRWQQLQQQPQVVVDTAHNINGLELVMHQLQQQDYTQLHMVIGMVKDKDITKMLALLPTNAFYYFTQADIPRALPAHELAELAAKYNLKGQSYTSVLGAKQAAINSAKPTDFIFIGGSTYIVAEAI